MSAIVGQIAGPVALVVASAAGQAGSIVSENVGLSDEGSNFSLTLQNIQWTSRPYPLGGSNSALVIDAKTAQVQVNAGSVFDANAGEISVAPEWNGAFTVDGIKSSVTTTGLLQVGNPNSDPKPAAQTASVTVQNSGKLSAG